MMRLFNWEKLNADRNSPWFALWVTSPGWIFYPLLLSPIIRVIFQELGSDHSTYPIAIRATAATIFAALGLFGVTIRLKGRQLLKSEQRNDDKTK